MRIESRGDLAAVITVGYVNAGIKHNVIPDQAHIGLNIVYNLDQRLEILLNYIMQYWIYVI